MVKHLNKHDLLYDLGYNMDLEKKGHMKPSLPCCSRILLGMQVQENKLI